jgi:hypothetical protein
MSLYGRRKESLTLFQQLPVYSGNTIVDLETDDALNQVIELLVEQSKSNPDLAVGYITEALVNLNKQKVRNNYYLVVAEV